jgi:hypothetical protein
MMAFYVGGFSRAGIAFRCQISAFSSQPTLLKGVHYMPVPALISDPREDAGRAKARQLFCGAWRVMRQARRRAARRVCAATRRAFCGRVLQLHREACRWSTNNKTTLAHVAGDLCGAPERVATEVGTAPAPRLALAACPGLSAYPAASPSSAARAAPARLLRRRLPWQRSREAIFHHLKNLVFEFSPPAMTTPMLAPLVDSDTIGKSKWEQVESRVEVQLTS